MRRILQRIQLLGPCLIAATFVSSVVTHGQDSRSTQRTDRPILETLKDSLKTVNEDIRLLQHFLEASTTDPRIIQHGLTKSWIISNPELRDSLFYAMVAVDSSVQSEAGADAEVLATEMNDLIEVRFGTAVFKGIALKDALAKSSDKRLYEKVVGSSLYSKHVELRNPAFKLPTRFEDDFTPYDKLLEEFTPVTIHTNPEGETAKVDLSLYGLIFKIGPSWGGEIRIGCDEVGFPFWSAGKTSYLITYKRIKLGFELPFRAGRHAVETFPPFTVHSRKLNGTRGMVGEFDLGPVGGLLSFTRLTDLDTRDLTDPNYFAYINTIVQGYYSFGVSLSPTNLVRVKVGAGYHRIVESRLVRKALDPMGTRYEETVLELGKKIYPSPYVKIEYLNKDEPQRFGGSLQYYDYSLLTTAWLEIVPKILYVELKYSWQVLRDPRTWEDTSFIIISPRIRLSL